MYCLNTPETIRKFNTGEVGITNNELIDLAEKYEALLYAINQVREPHMQLFVEDIQNRLTRIYGYLSARNELSKQYSPREEV